MLVDSIHRMKGTSLYLCPLMIEDKCVKTQEIMFERQLNYYKCKDNIINETHMNMVKTITRLTHVLNMVLMKNKVGGSFSGTITNLIGHDLLVGNESNLTIDKGEFFRSWQLT
jgi:hypothetical protein